MKAKDFQCVKDAGAVVQAQFKAVREAAGVPESLQKLVMTYHVSDGCTYSERCDVPVLYESGEALLVNLEAAALAWKAMDWHERAHKNTGWFLGVQLDYFFENGKYYAPSVSTLDEWFEDNVYHEPTALELATAGQPWLRTYDGRLG